MDGITEIENFSIYLLIITSILAGLAVPLVAFIMIKLGIVRDR